MDYGTRIAMQKARANAMRKRNAKPKRRVTDAPTPTKFTPYPMSNHTCEVRGHIDWNAPTTHDTATHLADQLTVHKRKMQLLQQPTGTGKTAVAVKAIALAQKKSPDRKCVILAPRAIIDSGSWHRTIAEWNAVNPDNQVNPVLIDTYGRFTGIISVPETRDALTDLLGKNPLLVIDEVHNYKNPTAKRSKALQKLKDATILGLSATPITNNVVLDMASYLIMAGFYRNKTDYLTKTELKDRLDQDFNFFIYNKRGHIDPLLWPKYPVVLAQLSTVVYRPDVSVTVDQLPNVESPMHRIELSDELAGDLRSIDRAYNKRMFDSAADYVLAIQQRINTDEHRLNWLIDTITGEGVRQPLVFYWHTAVRDALTDALTQAGIDYQVIAGDTSTAEVDKTDASRPILIQYQAGGEGIEFPHSNTTVFYENQGSYARLVQARGRNVRRDMNHDVTQNYCVSDAPFDTEVLDRVLRREEVSEKVLAEIALRVATK